MSDITVLFKDHSYAQVVADYGIIMEMTDYFSFEVDGYKFNPKYKYGQWDGRIRLMGNGGEIPTGLVSQIEKFASNMGYEVSFDPKLKPDPIMTRDEFDSWLSSKEIYAGNTRITPHWYQSDTVFESINKRRLVANLPTSAGKSLIQSLIARWYLENYEGKVLIIVPTTSLVTQMRDDFVDYRLFPSQAINLLGGGAKNAKYNNPDALITVSTWQTACKQDPEWFKQFGLVQNDECHLATGTNISKVIKQLSHCEFKFGLSGSLRDGKANIMQYVGLFGEIYRPVDTRKLMDDGQITEVDIKATILRYQDHECDACSNLDYQQEIKYIVNHSKRNAWICNLSKKLASRDENVLLLFRFTEHGKALYETMKKIHPEEKVIYISGETKTELRNEMRTIAESETGLVIVASYGVLSTGVSIKQLHHMIFASPVKSKVIVLQSIGRVLRKHKSKGKAFVWDIIDNIAQKSKTARAKNPYKKLNYAFKHGVERIQRYNQEKFNYSTVKVNL